MTNAALPVADPSPISMPAPVSPVTPPISQAGVSGSSMVITPQTAGAASRPPTAATAGRMASLDKDARFEWPETVPGQTQCEAGTYVGTFNCVLMADPSLGLLVPAGAEFAGPITLEFTRSADGEFLQLTNAKLEGIAADTIGFTASLDGKLDCSTHVLTATILNGQYGLGLPILIPGGELVGTLMGKLDSKSGELSGMWSITEKASDGLFACVGPWQAKQPP